MTTQNTRPRDIDHALLVQLFQRRYHVVVGLTIGG